MYNGGSLSQMVVTTVTTEGEESTTTTETLYFTYDASGNPQTVTYNGTLYYYSVNLQGDVVAILDSNGAAVVSYAYDAWGNLLSTTGTLASTLGTANPLTYRGYVYDSETSLYYLQSRYYNPEIGRFLNADALVSTGQGILGNNMFAYCGNNPVNNIDPTGNIWRVAIVIGICLLATTGCSEDAGPYSHQANCYTYAMRLEYDPRTGEPFKERIDPGVFSGDPLKREHGTEHAERVRYYIQSRVVKDAAELGYICYPVHSPDHPVRDGGWLIAIAFTSKSADDDWGYHFWRRDRDGTWSHKPGVKKVQYTDFSGNTIYDPRTCDRGKYDYWAGYFVLIPSPKGRG